MPCVCHAFASVHCCFFCHLLGKGWPLGSRLRCLIVPISHPGSGVVLDCIDSWSLPPFLLQPDPEVRGVCKDKVFASMWVHTSLSFNLICNMIMFWKKWATHPIPGLGWGGEVCGQNICYYVVAFLDCLLLDMQHDNVLKNEFWPTEPIPRDRGEVGCLWDNVCYHVVAFMILFILIL